MDAAHFVLGAFLAILWSLERIFVRTSPGRQRLNILGALNAVTHEMITITEENYVNGWSVVSLMRKLREIHPTEKLILVLDNARYQACHLVRSAANMLNIKLLFLPPYSPNLNLIERVWKFIKKKALNCIYHENFKSFTTSVFDCISKFTSEYREELKKLLTWNFQIFKENNIMKCT